MGGGEIGRAKAFVSSQSVVTLIKHSKIKREIEILIGDKSVEVVTKARAKLASKKKCVIDVGLEELIAPLKGLLEATWSNPSYPKSCLWLNIPIPKEDKSVTKLIVKIESKTS